MASPLRCFALTVRWRLAFFANFFVQDFTNCKRLNFAAGLATEAVDFEERVATEFETDEVTYFSTLPGL